MKYKVLLWVTSRYELFVEADDPEAAQDVASDDMCTDRSCTDWDVERTQAIPVADDTPLSPEFASWKRAMERLKKA